MKVRPVIINWHKRSAGVCIDVFVREDGTFGYQKLHRDPEGSGQWHVAGEPVGGAYDSYASALAAATEEIASRASTSPARTESAADPDNPQS